MNSLKNAIVLLLLLLTVACSRLDTDDQTAPKGQTPAPSETIAAPATQVISTPDVDPTLAPVDDVATQPTQPSQETGAHPAPSLFDVPWENLSIFEPGLIPSERAVLSDLDQATVYHMELQLEDPRRVSGRQEIRYTNTESEALEKLVLHLFPPTLGGAIDVPKITVNGNPANATNDDVTLQILFDAPLQPGDQVIVGLDFITTLPEGLGNKYGVLAYSDDILALAHSAPQVAVYEDGSWHTGPSAPHGDETFSDASLYLVRVIAPAEQVIVTSGTEIDKQINADTQELTVVNGPARDFYLAMSEDLQSVSEQVGDVTINSYAPAQFAEGAQMALEVARESVNSFSTRYGPYPYSELDIVTTPTLALGIEYPGVFANTLRIYDLSAGSQSGLSNATLLESTTAHETAHQWFYNVVGNDQLSEPWLDEALAQYATWMYFVDRYGEANAQGFYDSLDGRWARSGYQEKPIGLAADAYTGAEYGSIVYGRGPVFLNSLAQEMGQATFDAFLLDYGIQNRWQIATTDSFKSLAEQHCNCDLSLLFDEWVLSAN